VVKTPLSPPPSTAATVNDATINALGSIPLPLPSMMTTIAAVNDHHHRCHTVNDDDCQKSAVIFCHQGQQWRSLLTEAVVDAAATMVVFVHGSCCLRWQQWDGGTMTQWHLWQWCL
jgi:hypothetical protein